MSLRYLIPLMILASVNAQSGSLDTVFAENSIRNSSIENQSCNLIKKQTDRLMGCHNCFMCDAHQIQRHRQQKTTIRTIELRDENCQTVTVCCIAQTSLTSFRSKNNCGIENPEGYPRRIRPTSRSVLQGEFPWRAWVYRNDDHTKPICAATYVDENINGLIVPASCLVNQDEKTIFVVFNQNLQEAAKLKVNQIKLHENFTENHMNDVAIITLKSIPQRMHWIRPACLPQEPVQYGTTCLSISEDSNFIHVVVPQKTMCEKYNDATIEDEASNPTLMCSISVQKDYVPQYGSGLFCLAELNMRPQHVVYGMALYQKHDSKTFFTNVKLFSQWIESKLQEIFIRHHQTQ